MNQTHLETFIAIVEAGSFNKAADFQAHMLEHQLGAYTNCNHGEGLAVIHSVLYRHMLSEAEKQFARLAVNVWGISGDGKTEKQLAEEFINALSDFIKEVGLPTKFSEMGIDADYKAIADSTVLTGGCCKKFTREELLCVLNECS